VELTTRELRETLAATASPGVAVRAYAEAAAAIMRETDYTFGCPVAPVILDATADLAELAALCRGAFEEWTDLLRQAFVGAGIPEQRADGLALLVVTSIEGALLIARAYRDCDPLLKLAAELEAVVEAALPRTV
jgi:TetR/AcrR family transcriptional repressor of lmrAB and yxaGH operons